MRYIVLSLALFVLVLPTASAMAQKTTEPEKKEVQILEFYDCDGVDDAGKSYTFPLSVKNKEQNYSLFWGDNAQIGLGIRTGDTLSVVFSVRQGKPDAEGMSTYAVGGVVAYVVSPGKLTGKWAFGNGKVYNETCSSIP